MNMNKIKRAMSLKNNDFSVNAIMIGLPILAMIFTQILLSQIFVGDLLTSLSPILFGAMVFLGYFIFVSTLKYYGIKLTAKKWVMYIVVATATVMIIQLIFPEGLFSHLVGIVATIGVFAKIFKVKFGKAFSTLLTVEILQLLIVGTIFSLGVGGIVNLGASSWNELINMFAII